MKRSCAILFALLYLGASTGAAFTMHYCMGRQGEWKLGQRESLQCPVCGMKKKAGKDRGCCRDEHKLVKLSVDQKLPEAALAALKAPLAVIHDYNSRPVEPVVRTLAVSFPVNHGPPGGHLSASKNILYCCFLI